MKKILIRLGITISPPVIALIAFILFPGASYAHKTFVNQVSIYHNSTLDLNYEKVVMDAINIVSLSELYDPDFSIDLCLDDQSIYPDIINRVKGPAFGFGLANKVILKCEADFTKNKAFGYGEAWNLTGLIAHEMVHTYQYNAYGFSTLSTPSWKLEGYAEYISRNQYGSDHLRQSIAFMEKEQEREGDKFWFWIKLKDETGIPSEYLRSKNLVHYLIEIEGLSYHQIRKDERSREDIKLAMMNWHQSKNL